MSAQTQTVSQFVNYPGDKKSAPPQFAFLSKPPPPQRHRLGPNVPLPPPPSSPPAVQTTFCDRTNTYSSIIAWASLVQPGSPAPISPQRRPSISSSRRPSFSRLNRRPSISHGRAASGSLIHIVDTQKTPSVGDFDLTALGYTTVFVHLPKTPTTPSPYLRQRSGTTVEIPQISKPPSPPSAHAHAHIPVPPMPSEEPSIKRTGLSRFRSLSILRSRSSKPKQQPSVTPAKCKPTQSKKHPAPTETCSAVIAKRKRAKYAVAPPPPLANDLALMQFMEGGKIESHAKRVMEAQAKAAAGSGAGVGVGDVYRDGKGGIWWDADEEWEYTHLLADIGPITAPISLSGKVNEAMAVDWEDFETAEPCYDSFFTNLQVNQENDPLALERRDSVSSQDSDLDPKYLLTVPEYTPGGFNAPVEDRVLASRNIGGPGMSILSLPSRPRRKALHLNKAEFLVDLAAFGPRSPKSVVATNGAMSTKPNPKGQARRRPAPLKLSHQPQNAVVVVRRPAALGQVRTPAFESVEKVRKEFIADSFAPTPTITKTTSPPQQQIVNKKSSRKNMRGLFGRRVD
ncbi:hypothetical protein BYT27DRAFT_7241233 [Phlegmacium glaucopus]|nr:hypothetical protein BYT27DRAFT_7241233 [Phlegmacium glaucopus]